MVAVFAVGSKPSAPARCGSARGNGPVQGALPIGRRRSFQRREEPGKSLRINERIRKSPIRLIDDNNDQVGVIDTAEAMQRAKAAGLDLVEVSPNSDPPVCRIMDYGKWKYQQKKKEQKAKSHSKQSELKEVRLRPSTDTHDLDIKNNRAREFFEEGHKVQFTILFKGRQMAHRDIGFRLFDRIAEQFSDCAHVEMSPRVQGRRMTMMMAPGVKQKPKAPEPRQPAPAPQAANPPASAAAPASGDQPTLRERAAAAREASSTT